MSPDDPGPGICQCGHDEDDHDFRVSPAPWEKCQCREYEWVRDAWYRAGPTRRDLNRL